MKHSNFGIVGISQAMGHCISLAFSLDLADYYSGLILFRNGLRDVACIPDTYSEELLGIHDCEVQKMNDYYELNKEMLVKVHKREDLWKRMIHFEVIISFESIRNRMKRGRD